MSKTRKTAPPQNPNPSSELPLLPVNDYRLNYLEPPCAYCRHRTHMGQQKHPLEGWACTAYPKGIPYGILTRSYPHDEVLPDQEGEQLYESRSMEFPDGVWQITFEGDWMRVGDAQVNPVA